MVELAEDLCAMSMETVYHGGKRHDMTIACHGGLPGHDNTLAVVDPGGARNEQAQAVLRSLLVVIDELFGWSAVIVGHSRHHRHKNRPVPDRDVANRAFTEEMWVPHIRLLVRPQVVRNLNITSRPT